MGLVTAAERQEFESVCAQHPEVAEAREAFERSLEERLLSDAREAPASLKKSIEDRLATAGTESLSPDREEETPVRSIGIWKWLAAASLLLLLGAGYWAYTSNQKYKDSQAKLAALQKQLDESNDQLSAMKKDVEPLSHQGMKVAALKSPDNAAFATVFWDTASTSRDVYLMINNLPQPPTDKQYQLWALLNGTPIDLGMIEVKQRLLYRMKNVQDAQAFAITLEPRGGSQLPTSKPVALSNL